jgi:hypothetical protein
MLQPLLGAIASGAGGSSGPPTYVSVTTQDGGTANSVSFSITPSGTDRALLIGVHLGSPGTRTVTSVVFNTSENAVFVDRIESTGGNVATEVWKLINPTATTANLVVSMSGTSRFGVSVVLFNDADQTTFVDDVSKTTANSGTSISTDVTSNSNQWVFDFVTSRDGDGQNITAGAGQTDRANFVASVGSGGSSASAGVSQEAGATTTTMSWTGPSDEWAHIGVGVMGTGAAPSGVVKTILNTAIASVKTIHGTAIASVKTWLGLNV